MTLTTIPANEIRNGMIIRHDGQSWLVYDHMPLDSDATYTECVRIHAECVDGNVGRLMTWEFAAIDPVMILNGAG